MSRPATTREAASLAATFLGDWIGLHTADPGTTGASEAAGGSPAYARKQTTWSGGAADGTVTGSQVTIDCPADTYTHFGVWSDQTGGDFVGGGPLEPSEVTTPAQGQMRMNPSHSEIA